MSVEKFLLCFQVRDRNALLRWHKATRNKGTVKLIMSKFIAITLARSREWKQLTLLLQLQITIHSLEKLSSSNSKLNFLHFNDFLYFNKLEFHLTLSLRVLMVAFDNALYLCEKGNWVTTDIYYFLSVKHTAASFILFQQRQTTILSHGETLTKIALATSSVLRSFVPS
jgi:hypothetical protein